MTISNFNLSDTKDISDPRNDDDYDTFEYGTEPLPNDQTWVPRSADNQYAG